MKREVDTSEFDGELSVGYVAGAHGIRGALRVRMHDPDSQALEPDRLVILRNDRGEEVRRGRVERCAPQPGSDRVRLWLDGVDTREVAETLRGLDVRVPRDQLPALEEDEYYLADAVGLPVVRIVDGSEQPLGVVVGVTTNGVQDLFEVEWQSKGRGARVWLLPALPEFIETIEKDRLVADLPQDFLPTELDRPGGAGD